MGDRIVGRYKGQETGPLLIITAGMHGNEPAGVRALDLLFKMLEVEPITNPDFTYKGEIIGLIGNLEAYKQGRRFISKDLNRLWEKDFIQKIKITEKNQLKDEDWEIRDILDIIDDEIKGVKPNELYLLDLHTTSSDGGIFCIATEDKRSVEIAHDIHAPVILGLLNDISGTTLHYFNKENFGIPTTSIAFEGGHHDDPQSINRCIAAIVNFMRTVGVVRPEHIENRHDHILKKYSEHLPEIVEVIFKFHIEVNHKWQMKPGFKNFQKILKGDVLARYDGHEVTAPMDGMILMPLYQTQGNDGFFIVRKWSDIAKL